jgi:hypothetical protein
LRACQTPWRAALVASISPFDGDVEVVALAPERLQIAVELTDGHDAVEVGGVVVVVEDQVAAGCPVADVFRGRSCPSGAPSSESSMGSGAVFSAALWSRKESVSGSWAARSRAVALSESLPVSRVSPKLMRIGVPSRSREPGTAPGDGDGMLASDAPAAGSSSSSPPQAENGMVASSARSDAWRRVIATCSRRRRGGRRRGRSLRRGCRATGRRRRSPHRVRGGRWAGRSRRLSG